MMSNKTEGLGVADEAQGEIGIILPMHYLRID